MDMLFGLTGFFGFLIFLIWIVIAALTKRRKKPLALGLIISAVMFLAGISMANNKDSSKNVSTANKDTASKSESGALKETASKVSEDEQKAKAAAEEKANKEAEEKAKSMQEDDEPTFKISCIAVSYDEVARYPEKYLGKRMLFKGKVMQVLGSTAYSDMLVEVDGNILYVSCGYFNSYKGGRILKDDSINLWGYGVGIQSYTTVLGTKNSVPAVTALFISIY